MSNDGHVVINDAHEDDNAEAVIRRYLGGGAAVVLLGQNGNLVYVDPYTYALGVIDQEHLQIHNGKGYTVARRISIAQGGGTATFLASVPAATFPHFRHIIISSDGGPFDGDLYEGTTTTDDGTAVPVFNNNRNSTNGASVAVFSAPTVSADGTLVEPILAPGNKQTGSFGSDGSNEWILKPSTKYLFRITNNTSGGGSNDFVVNFFWYEG